MKKIAFLGLILSLILIACENNFLPRPNGYFRIDLPEKEYKRADTIPFPFSFDIPTYAHVNLERTRKDSNFLNIDFPRFSARLHLSYIPVDTNIAKLLEDARTLVFKHVSKAQDIKEDLVYNKEERIFGTYYQIAGDAASGTQFFITDSSNHFLRGALYFSAQPNYDSIAPVQDFLSADIENMIETFQWEDNN